MNTRTLTVTLNIEVRDMTTEELADAGAEPMEGEEDDDEGVPTLADTSPHEIAGLIPHTLTFGEVQDEMFAGSGVFVRLTKAEVEFAGWADA
jgi:hypothetical protein